MKAVPAVRAGMLLRFALPRSQPAHAEDGRFYGMLRERDLTPFGFLRLDMRPAHAISIEPHSFAFEMELGYQNTWALSRNVEKYLTNLESQGRREIGPAEVEAIRNLPGENYLLDVESATLDMTVHYKISSQWTAVRHRDRGVVSRRLHGFRHRSSFTTPSASAPSAARRSRATRPTSSSTSRARRSVLLDAPKTQGFTDPMFGLRYTGIKLPEALADVGGSGRQGAARRRTHAAVHRPHRLRHAGLGAAPGRDAMRFTWIFAAVYYAGEDVSRAARRPDRADHHPRLGAAARRHAPISTCRLMRAAACTRASRPISTNC